MNLKRFLTYFMRAQHAEPDKTSVRFVVGGEFLTVQRVEFDVGTNTWSVQLLKSNG